ncbi:heterokaryon incompatibility protein-domain-containing protein [Nemania abortiva]|nr:heterokaryon incompatibility protein-domain-containing protein [Nemania abortiva]
MEKYSLEGSLDQEDVPLTIRDTINLVDDLGKRYLWIDSLCIIQDDLADKREYLPMMGDIYNAAMFVIMAAVENAHSGLPGSGNHKRQFPRMTERIRGIDFTIGQPQLREHLATTTWNLRGWTYQEANLARRALVITNFQVYWSCREESWCEDRFTEFPKPINFPLKYNSLFDTTVSPYPSYSLELGLVIDLCPLGKYCRMARELSSRSFSDPRDCLWALLGILKSLLPKFPQGYIWAMPKSKLDAALLWETDHVRHLSHAFAIPTGKGEWRKMEIPSWCWIGKGTEIWYDGCYESIESMVRWHEPVNFGELGPLNGSQEEEEEEERARNLQSVISQPGHVSPGGAVFDFALLRFTTELASLKMHTLVSKPPKESGCPIIGSATISLLSGRNIGTMRVPIEAFSQKSEIRGDFILLSAMPRETGPATQQCEEPTYNVMLVNWSHDKRFASRISWTEVKKSAWEECERQRKTITLK